MDARIEPRRIAAYRAKLPPFEAMKGYLERIDLVRNYSNFGELSQRLRGRMAAAMAIAPPQLMLSSSGTAALVGAILATAGRSRPDRPLCLVPSYTFCATALAAELCGYTVHVVDIDAESWSMDARRTESHPLLRQAGLVVPVCPFGAQIDYRQWERFSEKTGVPVVIDGAATFERFVVDASALLGSVPIALSLHATKAFATGEGGAVICEDIKLIERTCRSFNFGMLNERSCRTAGFNGKMSEYHAAVGLAELDGWDAKGRGLRRVAEAYRREAALSGIEGRFLVAPEIASCYVLFRAGDADQAAAICARLESDAIEHRFWYGRGIHQEPYFASASRDETPVSDAIASTTIGLPTAPDLEDGQVRRVVQTVAAAL